VAATKIFVKLLAEGTECWRPINANPIGDDVFEVLGIVPAGEAWEFAPGARVRCKAKQFADGSMGLVAMELSIGEPQNASPRADGGH
jgi:hypothetical protein